MEDPIGKAIYDYHHFKQADEIIIHTNYTEDERIDPKYFFRDEEEMPALEKTAMDLCVGNVLDVGAGAGSHSLILQNRGINVTALEASPLATSVIKERNVRQVICSDIYEFSGQSYDTIVILMNGTGIGGTLEGLKILLLHLKSLLTPTGSILIDSSDIKYLFEEEDGSIWVELSNDNYFGEMEYTVIYKDHKSSFNWLFVDFEILKSIAKLLGLKCKLVEKGPHHDYLAQLEMVN
ncbi:MAG TPA: class I SAM-dependent methyltransferase [Mariniphaga sp.]|nr:class I SAM-dependent methyltransferase [Mariniphaga sp.]